MSDDDKIVVAQQIVGAFSEILSGGLGGALSVNMRALLIPSIRLMLDIPGATFRDLECLMKEDPELLATGMRSRHPEVANFFKEDFKRSSFGVTKQSIANKLASILNAGIFERVTCGRSTINLERALSSKKIVVFNLAQGRLGEEETQALGKLLIALIQGIGLRRQHILEDIRPLTHLIIDECQNFITPSIVKIIEETRKFGLGITLAQLSVGRGMGGEMAKVVSEMPHVRIVGRSGHGEARRSGDLVGVDPEEIGNLPAGQFFYKAGIAPAFRLHVRNDLLGFKNAMPATLWKGMRKIQRDLYYRKIAGNSERAEEPAEAVSPAPEPAQGVKKKKRVLR